MRIFSDLQLKIKSTRSVEDSQQCTCTACCLILPPSSVFLLRDESSVDKVRKCVAHGTIANINKRRDLTNAKRRISFDKKPYESISCLVTKGRYV
jgi:hypothetical protein